MKKIILSFVLATFLTPSWMSGVAYAIDPALAGCKNGQEPYYIKLLEPIRPVGGVGRVAGPIPIGGEEGLEDLTGSEGRWIKGCDGIELFLNYVSRLYNYAAYVAGLFCVAVIIFQSVNIMMGGVDNSLVSTAKDKIMSAIFSLILLLAAAMVLRLVNPNFYT